MENMNELINFIKKHKDWKELLKAPKYSIKITECPWNSYWFMFNYNQFASDFSNPIVKVCRGCILEIIDDNIKVICYPYEKFFNYGDPNCDDLNWSDMIVSNKLDGMLLKLFKYKGIPYVVTNGSWSPYNLEMDGVIGGDLVMSLFGINPKKGILSDKELKQVPFGNNLSNIKWVNDIPDNYTLMFEICSPYNRIICKYTEPKLWFHGVRNNLTYKEEDAKEFKKKYGIPLDVPDIYGFDNVGSILNYLDSVNGNLFEGFVVRDKNFNRIKMKAKDYLRIKYYLGEDGITNKKVFMAIINEEEDDLAEFMDRIEIGKIKEFKLRIQKVSEALEEQKTLALKELEYINNDMMAFSNWVNSSTLGNLYYMMIKKPGNVWENYKKANKSKKDFYERFLALEENLRIRTDTESTS